MIGSFSCCWQHLMMHCRMESYIKKSKNTFPALTALDNSEFFFPRTFIGIYQIKKADGCQRLSKDTFLFIYSKVSSIDFYVLVVFFPYSVGPMNTISFMVPAEPLQNFINFYLSLDKKHNYYGQHLNSSLGLQKSIRTWKIIFICLCNREKKSIGVLKRPK